MCLHARQRRSNCRKQQSNERQSLMQPVVQPVHGLRRRARWPSKEQQKMQRRRRDRHRKHDLASLGETLPGLPFTLLLARVEIHLLADPRLTNVSIQDQALPMTTTSAVSYTHLRAHETVLDLVCR